ncbi:MAG: hypothetical protein A2831_00120 [Candidatus Yanofskybacteria bacterium RIFCSPHIGHO2_01_FULL_44_17]|uniref:Bacterial type II secretion system protein E domain-containing protein n=1 Tax=Candidatus Yanofskybacteria bacterium RIFCSPHIGHO2_01_FULL_44_17 TaxID=1802668 RepID=A0A1F8ESW6_9BACT|nr:MAG: hypothetical protein A2831_00120 [Candidatus Yanofskybacteria bacterium RIFCSPHIGHO2_01_FULL_44_17]
MQTTKHKIEQELKKGSDLSMINLVDELIRFANESRASDIHFDPNEKGIRIRFRIDGVLQDMFSFPREIKSEVISRIKVLAGLRTDEHQTAQDGRFRSLFEDLGPVDIRVSIAPAYYGENAVLRLLSDKAEEFNLDLLGFSDADAENVLRAVKRPHGMILSTGPTGSGKTTLLYTLIKLLNTKEISIITIEDPIEYSIEGINQIQVNSRTGLSFANGLRSVLRQDPDIIMVGEIRDSETAALAVNTALTGHLLLSTLHTNDAATTLPRLLDMKIEPYLVASTVNLVMAQRLVRKICPVCKDKKPISENERKSLSGLFSASLLEPIKNFYNGKGCDKCGQSGYRGRLGVYEVMVIDESIREAFLRRASATEIRQLAIAKGMTPMIEDGFRKAVSGLTTIEEVLRVIHE